MDLFFSFVVDMKDLLITTVWYFLTGRTWSAVYDLH